MDINLTGQIVNHTGLVVVSTLDQFITALGCNSGTCSEYEKFYSSLMNITITLFSLSGISIFYFWEKHEEKKKKIMAIDKIMLLYKEVPSTNKGWKEIEGQLENEVKNMIGSNALDLGAQMRRDAYQELYIYNRDWFSTKPIPNWILSVLSVVALFLGLIVPMYLQLPDPIMPHFISCELIFGVILIGTIICLLILGYAAYAKSREG